MAHYPKLTKLTYIYEIGQYVPDQGGVIFHRYLDGGNQNYLVVALTDQSTGQTWSNVATTLIGSTAQSTWDGLSNSNAITGQTSFTNGAALTCLNYSVGSINDWYLPAIDELNLLWQNRFNVTRTLDGASSAGLISGATILKISGYWSSTEINNSGARYISFGDTGANYNGSKNGGFYVRAIRKFSL